MDYLYFLQNLREGALSFLNPILLCISEAGLVIAVFAGFIIYWAFDKQSGKKIICGFALSTAFSNFIKDIFCISRPWISDARLHVDPIASKTATGYSFPSGHSTTAASVFGGIAFWKRARKLIAVLFWLLVIVILFARNWLGCHTLLDVSAGFAIGTCFMLLSFFLLDKIEASFKAELIFFGAGILFCAGAIYFLLTKSYPVILDAEGKLLVDVVSMKAEGVKNIANFAGFLIGWFLERRFVNFEIPETKGKKVLATVLGFLTAALLYKVICPLSLKSVDVIVRGFITHFVLFFWGIFGFPAVLRLFKKSSKKII